mmetsp:Transcript_118324/g.312795  ORF Transcript_118324/g.312795 Transcript_118324/m.312795 type:complete len:205 (-) Transcript_118324:422-1036(-)
MSLTTPGSSARRSAGTSRAPSSASSRDASARSDGSCTRYTSALVSEGAPPNTSSECRPTEATAAVVLGLTSWDSSSDQVPATTSKSSTVGCVSARPKTSSQPPAAARYLSPCSATSRAPLRAICSGAQGNHWPRSRSSTSQDLSVSMNASRGRASACSEQPPTAYARPRSTAQPWPQRARSMSATLASQASCMGSNASHVARRP